MNKLLTLVTFIAAAACASAQNTGSNPRFFVGAGPSVGFFGDDFETAPGGNVTLGLKFANQHSLEFEASFYKTELEANSAYDVTFIPLLGKYRLPIPLSESVSLSVAVVAGGMYEKVKVSGYWDNWSTKDGAFVGGGEVALDFAVNTKFQVGAAATALYSSETDITTSGSIALLNLRASLTF